jgi:hypothetical protein
MANSLAEAGAGLDETVLAIRFVHFLFKALERRRDHILWYLRDQPSWLKIASARGSRDASRSKVEVAGFLFREFDSLTSQ